MLGNVLNKNNDLSKKKHNSKVLLVISLILSIVFMELMFVSAEDCTTISDSLINDTSINSVGLNLTINITQPLYMSLIVCNNSIYFENLRSSETSGNTISFNITESNKEYLESNLPYVTSISNIEKDIIYGLTNDSSTNEITIEISCSNLGVITLTNPSGTITKLQNTWLSTDYTCTNGIITFNNLNLENGINRLEFDYSCSNFTLLGYRLIMIIASLLLVAFMVYRIKENGFDGWTIGSFVVFAIMIIVSLVLWLASGQNLGGSCPVT